MADTATSSGSTQRHKAGSTVSRATIKENSALHQAVKDSGGIDTLEGTRVCAAAAANPDNVEQQDYDVNPHTYWNADHSVFNLRAGTNYEKKKKKEPSGPALYDLYKMDIVQDSANLKNVSDAFEIPDIPGITDIQAAVKEVPPMMIINVGLPFKEPNIFSSETDGPTCIVILYFVITARTLEELEDLDNASPAVKLFAEWCKRGESDFDFRSRLKALAFVEEMDKLGFPSFINGYNGKPALITKSGNYVRHENYGEMAINVFKWGYLAKKGLYTLRDEFPRFRVNIGFVVEGRKDEELPEILLGGIRAMHMNLAKVPRVSVASSAPSKKGKKLMKIRPKSAKAGSSFFN